MKKKLIYVCVCLAPVMTGCSADSLQEEAEESLMTFFPVQFVMQMEKEILSFPPTKNMPDPAFPEPVLPADTAEDNRDTELNDLCSAIEYVVYKKEEDHPAFVKHKRYVYDPDDWDADFGCVYDSLPKGDYTFCFLAHNSGRADLSGCIFSFDSVTDTFYEAFPLEVGSGEELNKGVTLHRIVSRIEFVAADTVHEDLKRFDMQIEGRSSQVELLTGGGIRAVSQETVSHVFTAEELGEENKTHAFYTFVPPDSNRISVRLSSIAHNDAILCERFIENILPEKNKIIRYSGRLYTRPESDDTFFVNIYGNGEWGEVEENELPD